MHFTLTEYRGSRIVTASVILDHDRLFLDFSVEDSSIHWPAFSQRHRADNLWQDTCLELFIGATDDKTYHELNLAPGGGWNCYQFTDYREGMLPSDDFELLDQQTAHCRLSAELRCPTPARRLTIGPAAVIRSGDNLAYFAEQHGDQPDFHNRQRHRVVQRQALAG